MNIKEIIKVWLQENGYDGLVDQDGECGCEIADLMPCDEPSPYCMAGHKKEVDPATGYDFRIIAGKRA